MRKLAVVIGIFLLGAWIGYAQSTTSQVGSVVTGTHTACTVTASTTQICFASDGLWLSVSGAAYVQVQTGTVAVGVTSVTANGVKLTGDVVLPTIPTKVSVTVSTPIATGALQ